MKVKINFFKITIIATCILVISSCGLLFKTPPKGAALYYKITDIKIELMKLDSANQNFIVLDTTKILRNENIYFKLIFKIEANKEAERGEYPGQAFSKCSKESITKFDMIVIKPNGEKQSLINSLVQTDTSKKYKSRPFLSDVTGMTFKDIKDLVNKLNTCHSDVNPWSPFWPHGAVFICKATPVNQDGKYLISTEINFSDSRTVKNEIKINGKVK